MVACQATQMPPSAASCTLTVAKPVHAPLSQTSWAPWYKARTAKTASNATWAFLPMTGMRPITCEAPHVTPDSIADDELRCTWKNMSFNFLFSALRSLRPADDVCADARASFARAVDGEVSPIYYSRLSSSSGLNWRTFHWLSRLTSDTNRP